MTPWPGFAGSQAERVCLDHLAPWLLAQRGTVEGVVVLIAAMLRAPVRLQVEAHELRALEPPLQRDRRRLGSWVLGERVDVGWRRHRIEVGQLDDAGRQRLAAAGWIANEGLGAWAPTRRLRALPHLVAPLGHEFEWRILTPDVSKHLRPFVIGRHGHMELGSGICIGGVPPGVR